MFFSSNSFHDCIFHQIIFINTIINFIKSCFKTLFQILFHHFLFKILTYYNMNQNFFFNTIENWFIWKLTVDFFEQKGFWYILNLMNTNESRFFCFDWKWNSQMKQQIQNKKNDKIINKWWTAWLIHQNYNMSIVKCFLLIHICFCSKTMTQFFWKIISKSVSKKNNDDDIRRIIKYVNNFLLLFLIKMLMINRFFKKSCNHDFFMIENQFNFDWLLIHAIISLGLFMKIIENPHFWWLMKCLIDIKDIQMMKRIAAGNRIKDLYYSK